MARRELARGQAGDHRVRLGLARELGAKALQHLHEQRHLVGLQRVPQRGADVAGVGQLRRLREMPAAPLREFSRRPASLQQLGVHRLAQRHAFLAARRRALQHVGHAAPRLVQVAVERARADVPQAAQVVDGGFVGAPAVAGVEPGDGQHAEMAGEGQERPPAGALQPGGVVDGGVERRDVGTQPRRRPAQQQGDRLAVVGIGAQRVAGRSEHRLQVAPGEPERGAPALAEEIAEAAFARRREGAYQQGFGGFRRNQGRSRHVCSLAGAGENGDRLGFVSLSQRRRVGPLHRDARTRRIVYRLCNMAHPPVGGGVCRTR